MTWCAVQLGNYSTKARMKAMVAGIRACGGEVVTHLSGNANTIRTIAGTGAIRFAFTCGMHGMESDARGALRAIGIPLVVLDCGYLRRASCPEDKKGYNQVGLGGLCWVPPDDCPSDRFDALAMPVTAPKTDAPKAVLVLGQVPNDSQHHMSGDQLGAWLSEKAGFWQARGYTVKLRPHPLAPRLRIQSVALATNPARPLSRDLAETGVCVTFNSTAGLEALMSGVPVDCSPGAHYARCMTKTDAPEIDTAALARHLRCIAYAQWTCEEIAKGLPLRYLNRYAPILP